MELIFIQNYKLYQRLRDCREDMDLTQSKIAEMLSMGTTQYRRYELSESPISLELAEILASIYNVSLDYLAGRTNDKRGLTRSELSDEETDIIKKYRSLSEKRQGRILGQLEALTEEENEETKLKGAV